MADQAMNSLPAGAARLRLSISDPLPEIADAARYLDAAVSAHLQGKPALAEELIRVADMPEIRKWLKTIWADSTVHLRFPSVEEPPSLSKELRARDRMPPKADKERIHLRDGYTCRFCGIPVVRPETRKRIRAIYPNALIWGDKEIQQHAAFQAMWAQYDHVVPHAKGGTNDLDNLVLTCAACNFGRGSYTLEEVGVADPRSRPPIRTAWDGLERFR
jgi:5-methylcytosine-specific restriction endonuclease McrA